MIVSIILLVILAGYFRGKMDALVDEGIKNKDWVNKYNFNSSSLRKHWWYFGLHKPKYNERFPFSSTSLVFLTDKWHLNQFFMLRCYYLAASLLLSKSIILIISTAFILFPVISGVVFETTYQIVRKKINSKKQKL